MVSKVGEVIFMLVSCSKIYLRKTSPPKARCASPRIARRGYARSNPRLLPDDVPLESSFGGVDSMMEKRLEAIEKKRPYFIFLEGVSGNWKAKLIKRLEKVNSPHATLLTLV